MMSNLSSGGQHVVPRIVIMHGGARIVEDVVILGLKYREVAGGMIFSISQIVDFLDLRDATTNVPAVTPAPNPTISTE